MDDKDGRHYPLVLRFISDPRHGWAEVPAFLCKGLGLGDDYTSRDGWYYLEEDCEAADLDRAAASNGVTLCFNHIEVDDFDSWLFGDTWPDFGDNE